MMPKALNESRQKTIKSAQALKKRAMIQALKKHKGLVTYACEASGVCRATYYKWLKTDEKFKDDVDSIEDFVLDHVENCAHSLMEEGNSQMTTFFLKTRGRKRGFNEKQEVEHSLGDVSSLKDLMIDLITEYEAEY